ncbi:MATE family efflux transporter [Clostridium rectalis]|uniref:MATE family efflux transporter n=1 Tax=Clostridium rectalis TaxID=2040295 RepID=UPI000F63246A|nr:MATE family efflux transporter [Clostridium rectalis]
MNRQKQLRTENINSLLFRFSIPAIIGMLVNAFYNIVDRIFIGHIPNVGSMAITGVGLTLPIMTIILAFGMLIGIGSSALVSIKLGEQKKDEAENILGNAFVLLCIFTILVSIVGIIFLDPLLKSFGASEDTFIYAKEYVTIILIGAITNSLGFGLNSIIRAEGNPKVAMLTMLLGAVLNTILDPIFINIFNMGVKGAAYATIISQTANTIWVLYYFTGKNSSLKLKIKYFKLNKNIFIDIISIGMAPFFMELASSIVNIISNNSLKIYGGDLAIGAMAIINSISLVFFMPIFGINQGAQPIIGYNYGAKQYSRVKTAMKLSIKAACVICLLGFSFIEFFPETIIKIFSKDPQLIQIASEGIRIFLVMMPIIGFQMISSNYFQSVGKAKIATFTSLLRQVIILIPMLIILPKHFGLLGVWMSAPISDLSSAIITGVFLFKEMKCLDKKINLTFKETVA